MEFQPHIVCTSSQSILTTLFSSPPLKHNLSTYWQKHNHRHNLPKRPLSIGKPPSRRCRHIALKPAQAEIAPKLHAYTECNRRAYGEPDPRQLLWI